APVEVPAGYEAAKAATRRVAASALNASPSAATIFGDTSQDFARGHVPGARWVPRGWLEFWVADIVPSKSTRMTVTCNDGMGSTLAAVTLAELGYTDVTVLDGGMAAWQQAGL